MSFTGWLTNFAPTRFARDWGQRFVGGIGLVHDAIWDGLWCAFDAGSPHVGPDDALIYQGRDRTLVKGPTETLDHYRERLKYPWDAHSQMGTVAGITDQLEKALGVTGVVVRSATDWGMTGTWSRFWVLIPEGGHTYVIDLSSEEQRTVRQIIEGARPAHEVCVEGIIIRGGRLWGYPEMTWGEADAAGLTWGDTVVQRIEVSI